MTENSNILTKTAVNVYNKHPDTEKENDFFIDTGYFIHKISIIRDHFDK